MFGNSRKYRLAKNPDSFAKNRHFISHSVLRLVTDKGNLLLPLNEVKYCDSTDGYRKISNQCRILRLIEPRILIEGTGNGHQLIGPWRSMHRIKGHKDIQHSSWMPGLEPPPDVNPTKNVPSKCPAR